TATNASLKYFERKAPVQLHPRCAKQSADRPCGPSLLSDDLTQIARRDAQLEYRNLFAFHFANRHFIRNIDKRLGDLCHQIFHPFSPSCWVDCSSKTSTQRVRDSISATGRPYPTGGRRS